MTDSRKLMFLTFLTTDKVFFFFYIPLASVIYGMIYFLAALVMISFELQGQVVQSLIKLIQG